MSCFGISHRVNTCLQDIGLIIKPLPVVCQWVGFGPINLAELLQARVCTTPPALA